MAVVGRPNVGKSTLVNRIATGQQAIVHSEPGVTRDRNYVPTDWGGRQFTLIDTGGLMLESAGGSDNGVIEGTVVEQALFAVKEADLVLFVVDGDSGLLAGDAEIARVLREAAKPALIVVNNIDAREKESHALEFYRLGLGDPLQVSAAHGLGIGDLLDELTKTLPEVDDLVPEVDVFARVAIVGRPNVGKSTLVNRLLGSERVIVHEEAGTTRDSVDTFLDHGGDRFCLVDTAGLKRRSKIARDVDYFGLVRTLRSLDRADCAVVLTDAVEGVTKQDLRIIGYAVERGAACVVAPNKIDLVDGPERQHIAGEARRKMPFLSYLPVLPISAEKGRGVNDLLGLVTE
ncbi:MAG: ribosome biogenesis GTPase Der, partial [Terriglobia bacterium]